MNPTQLSAERQNLEFMLGIGPPVLLDIKPIGLLRSGERRLFTERLAEVTAELKWRRQTPDDRQAL